MARQGYNFAANHIYSHSDISAEHYKLCDRMTIELLKSAIRVAFLQLFSMSLMALSPLYKILFTDEKELMVPVIIPFVDSDTKNGFYFNLANQLLILGGGIFIVPGTELVICFIRNNLIATAHVIKTAICEFDESLVTHKKFSRNHISQWRNILLQILDFDRFDSI